MSKAASLVAQAKAWATSYGDFPNGPEAAALSAPLRVRAGWDANDADAVAAVFLDNGSLLIGDEQIDGADHIREYLTAWFGDRYPGVRLEDRPLDIRFLTSDVAVAVTEGGLVLSGEDGLAPERTERSMWVLVRRDGEWRVAARQSSPING